MTTIYIDIPASELREGDIVHGGEPFEVYREQIIGPPVINDDQVEVLVKDLDGTGFIERGCWHRLDELEVERERGKIIDQLAESALDWGEVVA